MLPTLSIQGQCLCRIQQQASQGVPHTCIFLLTPDSQPWTFQFHLLLPSSLCRLQKHPKGQPAIFFSAAPREEETELANRILAQISLVHLQVLANQSLQALQEIKGREWRSSKYISHCLQLELGPGSLVFRQLGKTLISWSIKFLQQKYSPLSCTSVEFLPQLSLNKQRRTKRKGEQHVFSLKKERMKKDCIGGVLERKLGQKQKI